MQHFFLQINFSYLDINKAILGTRFCIFVFFIYEIVYFNSEAINTGEWCPDTFTLLAISPNFIYLINGAVLLPNDINILEVLTIVILTVVAYSLSIEFALEIVTLIAGIERILRVWIYFNLAR